MEFGVLILIMQSLFQIRWNIIILDANYYLVDPIPDERRTGLVSWVSSRGSLFHGE